MDNTFLKRSQKARQSIFDRLRGSSSSLPPSDRAKAADVAPSQKPPKLASDAQFTFFCDQLKGQGTKIDRVQTDGDLPSVLACMLNHFAADGGTMWQHPSLAPIALQGWEIQSAPPHDQTLASVTFGFGGASETGTIMMVNDKEQGALGNFLPPIHIVLLYRCAIYADYEDLWHGLDLKHGEGMPSLVHWISGPSRTADIEQKLVQGAHGPKHLGLIILEEE